MISMQTDYARDASVQYAQEYSPRIKNPVRLNTGVGAVRIRQ